MRDIIEAIRLGELTLNEAEQIIDKELEKFHQGDVDRDLLSDLGFTEYEATAYAHGASIEDLLTFRNEGWPKYCYRCGKPIDIQNYGWWFEHKGNGQPSIRHVICPV